MSDRTLNLQPRILVVDDNAAIHEDFRKILGGRTAAGTRLTTAENALFGGDAPNPVTRTEFRIDSAYQGQEALKLVQKSLAENDPYTLAFVDIRMPPGWDGVETLGHIWQCCPDLQVVFCTAYSDYSWDDVIRKFGQTDNLLILKKPFETVEVLQIAHALAKKWELAGQARLRLDDLDRMVRERTQKLSQEIEDRTRVQTALRISEERFSKAFQASPMPMAIQNHPEGRFLAVNSSFLELAGFTDEQFLQRTSDELRLWECDPAHKAAAPSDNRIRNRACALRRSDGTTRNTMLWTEPITLDAGPCLLVIVEDVTDQLKMEAQLRQSQKMEAVGRLATGIAHEFNNILTVIQGHAGLVCAKATDARFVGESAGRIGQASARAAALVGQMLAFSRKQPLQLNPVNLGAVILHAQKTFGRLIGERHEVQIHCAENLPAIRADEASIEQIFINLALNARDAMPTGGLIRMETSLVAVDAATAFKNPDARAGDFVCLTVADTGCGISPMVLTRIFDPFFTTKEVGKGTGMGLSTVHGLVQQHQGWIEVASQADQGTTFKIFLPVWAGAPPTQTTAHAHDPVLARGSGERVLVVEDEAIVRELARVALEQGGYEVLEAADGQEALELWDRSPVSIDVLVTDIVLPRGPNGGMLARMLQTKAPGLQVIYTSGYDSEFIQNDLPSEPDTSFLAKPYNAHSLLHAVKRRLNGSIPGPAGAGTEATASAMLVH